MNRFVIATSILALLLTFGCQKNEEIPMPTEAPPVPKIEKPPEPVKEEPKPVVEEVPEPDPLDELIKDNPLNDVFFEFDKSELRPDARRTLERHAEVLKANPGLKVLIEGHCDERGTDDYNLALGERRATAVRDYMISLGVSANVLKTISYGESRPKDPRSNEEAWAKNRRCHFVLDKL